MRERLKGERFIPDEHAHLPTDGELQAMGVRSITPLTEIKGIQGPDFYTQYFEQGVEFVDGWQYRMTHAKIPREHQVTDVSAFMTTPWTVRRNGFVQHQMQTVSEFGEEVTLASTPLNLNKGAGNFEANSRNYARIPRLSAVVMGNNERDADFGIVIGDSRGANYGEGVAAYGPEHGFDSLYNDLRVASQINGIPEVIELQAMFRGMSPEQMAEKIRNGEIPAHLNPIRISKLLFRTVKRINSTFSPEFGPAVDLLKDPVQMFADGATFKEVAEHTRNKFSLDSLDLPISAIKHYPSSFDIVPRGAYRQVMEFLPLTDGSYGKAVQDVLRRYQFQYLSGNKDDGLSLFHEVVAAHDPTEFPHTITNVQEGTHSGVIRRKSHTSRVERLGSVIIPMIAAHGDRLKAMTPAERAKVMHELAAISLPSVFGGTESALPENYSAAA
ncbi:MAG: hypothetical protein JWO07_707 [Candidatus Saccharibacteria bacterium]|nr:hypothetical protein [Candidatus Saccharibacteria bacterium]